MPGLMKLIIVLLIASLALALVASAEQGIDVDQLREAIDAGKQRESGVIANPADIEARGRERASKANEGIRSEQYQEALKAETERLKKGALRAAFPDDSGGNIAPGRARKEPVLSGQERIYVFVSSSMPTETVRAYVQDIDMLHDPNVVLVMRGMVGGLKKMGPMRDFFAKVALKDPGCDQTTVCELYSPNLIVDPLLFRRYGISYVPAVVYVPAISWAGFGSEGLEAQARVDDYFVRHGDASLAWHLGVIHKETKRASLALAVKKLKGERK